MDWSFNSHACIIAYFEEREGERRTGGEEGREEKGEEERS